MLFVSWEAARRVFDGSGPKNLEVVACCDTRSTDGACWLGTMSDLRRAWSRGGPNRVLLDFVGAAPAWVVGRSVWWHSSPPVSSQATPSLPRAAPCQPGAAPC